MSCYMILIHTHSTWFSLLLTASCVISYLWCNTSDSERFTSLSHYIQLWMYCLFIVQSQIYIPFTLYCFTAVLSIVLNIPFSCCYARILMYCLFTVLFLPCVQCCISLLCNNHMYSTALVILKGWHPIHIVLLHCLLYCFCWLSLYVAPWLKEKCTSSQLLMTMK